LIAVASLAAACSRDGVKPTTITAPGPTEPNTSDARTSDTQSHVVLTRDEATRALCELYEALDTDCDRRLTVLDQRGRCEQAPCPLHMTVKLAARELNLTSIHTASQLATELAEALLDSSNAEATITIDTSRVFQNPVRYLETRIKTRYWDGLTRVITPSGPTLRQALVDEKQATGGAETLSLCGLPATCPARPDLSKTKATTSSPLYLYVPEQDVQARALYAPLSGTKDFTLGTVPPRVDAAWVNELTRHRRHGLLSLAYDESNTPLPFVVPGGRFNEMYGWDSYFIVLGLLESGRLQLARHMAEHQAYQIRNYGKVLNANRTYYLTRSQPPFFPALVRSVLAASKSHGEPSTDGAKADQGAAFDNTWRKRMLEAAELEYTSVWAAPPRRTKLCEGDVCLARYYGEGSGQPPEVEPGHFAALYQAHATNHGHCAKPNETAQSRAAFVECAQDLEAAYVRGSLRDPELDAEFVHDQCVRESGHDTTFRWFQRGQERCADYVTVDLNSLLLQYELDVAHLYARGGAAEATAAQTWCERARARARLINRHLWDETRGVYFDFNVVTQQRSNYLSAASLYPLWVSTDNECHVSLLEPSRAKTLVGSVLPRLEAPGGLLATDPTSLKAVTQPTVVQTASLPTAALPTAAHQTEGPSVTTTPPRQWEAPNGWAPHQMLAWAGLQQHGFGEEAQRLAYRWLLLIAESSANFHGTVPEKFDVVARTHRVFAEYGNVNTKFDYIATEGFGWMNASFLVGLNVLSPAQRDKLFDLVSTNDVFVNQTKPSQ
jgi:alpha,alpha-trehalase